MVDKDDRIYLICNATGQEYPPDDLDWFIEGNKLTTSADEKVSHLPVGYQLERVVH